MSGSAEKKGRGRREQEDISFYRRSSAFVSVASSIIIQFIGGSILRKDFQEKLVLYEWPYDIILSNT